MKRKLQTGWSFLLGLGQGILAARKWLIAYVILILVPASVMLVSYYQRSSQILEEEVTRTMQQTLKQAALNLTYKLNHVRDISNAIFMNKTLYDNLVTQQDVTKQLEQMEQLRSLAEIAQSNEDVLRMRIFVDRSKLYASERINLFSIETIKDKPWYQPVMDAGGSIVWTEAYMQSYYDIGEKNVFSVARVLRNPQQFNDIMGILALDVSDTMVAEVLSVLNFSTINSPYLMDSEGKLIYRSGGSPQSGASLAESRLDMIRSDKEGILKGRVDNEDKYVVFATVGTTGWKLVAELPKSEISHRASALNQFSSIATLVGITFMFLLLVFVLLTFTVQGMNRRIQMVLKMMRKEGMGWLEERKSMPEGDFRLLERSVDQLIRRVNNLMEETYQAKVQEREAQLRALQAQINPHFLYNALDMINWTAIAHNAEDTSQMIEALAQYFRLSLNKGRDNVSITDELNLAKVYLEIQQNRFPSTFSFVIESDQEVAGYIIPKLTLQPLVENALLHGIRNAKDRRGTIRITANKVNSEVVLTVTDDGSGMEEELARRLLVEPRPNERPDGSGSSYGLYNVNERIRYFAGETYGLTIHTRPGYGTTIEVRLKAVGAVE